MPAALPFEVERLGVKFGAEVRGLDLKAPMDRDAFAGFEAALLEHPAQHRAASDYYPQRRRMERTAMAGDVPY